MDKKKKPLYDENGKWVNQDSRILSGIRKAYRLSPQMQEALREARVELPPLPLKSGKPGKRVRVRFKCSSCGELFSGKRVQVDHIEPATPLEKTVGEMSWDEVIDGIFCKVDNLQVLCSIPMSKNGGVPSCHAKKSAKENWIRRKLKSGEYDPKMLNRMEVIEEEYNQYLVEKEDLRLAKEARKKERERKKLLKLNKA